MKSDVEKNGNTLANCLLKKRKLSGEGQKCKSLKYMELVSWLTPFIKHREMDSNMYKDFFCHDKCNILYRRVPFFQKMAPFSAQPHISHISNNVIFYEWV